MSKASSLFVLILFAALVSQVNAQVRPGPGPVQSYAQSDQVISQRISQSLRMREVRRISELLRLSMSESMDLQASSLTILAQSLRGPAMIVISSRGRLISSQSVRRQLSEVTMLIPPMTSLDELELSVSDDVIIDTVSALVRSSRSQGPGPGRQMQPMSGQMLRLDVRQDIRYSGEIHLKQLVKQQLGLNLEGVQIERIAVEAQVMRGFSASVQVELNGRLVGPVKTINTSQIVTPIPLNSIEEVRGSLRLLVRGDVVINQVHIRIGQVRPIQSYGGGRQVERFQVFQEISSGRPLELSRLLPYDNRLVSSISIDGRSSRSSSAEVALVAMGQLIGSVIVTQVPMRPMIQLMRPASLRELSLQSLSPVIIDALEIGFDDHQMW